MAAPTTVRAASTRQSEAESLSLTCPDWPDSRDDIDRVWRLSEQLTGVTYPP